MVINLYNLYKVTLNLYLYDYINDETKDFIKNNNVTQLTFHTKTRIKSRQIFVCFF